MSCAAIRKRLSAGRASAPDVAVHLTGCAGCRRFAARLAAARAALGAARIEVTPDAGFAARVVAALPAAPHPLALFAVRLLPATLALAIVLSGWCVLATASPSQLVGSSPLDDPLGWVADLEEGS